MQNKGLLWSLLVGAIIVLASISCNKKNTATSIDSSLNSRSFSTWKSDNSTSRPPFRLNIQLFA